MWLQFTIAVTRRVLAPSQAAALDVAAFQVPTVPALRWPVSMVLSVATELTAVQAGAVDMPALAEALAEAAGEVPAAQLLTQGLFSCAPDISIPCQPDVMHKSCACEDWLNPVGVFPSCQQLAQN